MGPVELGSWSYPPIPRESMEPASPARWKFPECEFRCGGEESAFRFLSQNKAGESGRMGEVNGD